jgi:hypothetical protein
MSRPKTHAQLKKTGVYSQCKSLIYLDLIVKNKEVPIERYFKWWISIKLVSQVPKLLTY